MTRILLGMATSLHGEEYDCLSAARSLRSAETGLDSLQRRKQGGTRTAKVQADKMLRAGTKLRTRVQPHFGFLQQKAIWGGRHPASEHQLAEIQPRQVSR